MTEWLGSSDKDFKVVMIKMLQWKIMNMPETKEKIENLCKEIEDLKKNQVEISELKIQ